MLVVENLKGEQFAAYAEVKRTRRLNGEREISLSFLSSNINDPFIYDIDMRWLIHFDNEAYVVIDPSKSTDEGNNIVTEVTAVKKFFVDNNDVRLYDEVEKSMTAFDYFDSLYRHTNKTVNLVDNFYASSVALSNGQTVQERHNKGLEYYDAEQVISKDSSRVDLYNTVGRELDKIFHEDLNMSNFKWDVSSSGFHTYAKGFGKQNEDGTYVVEEEYTSPLIDIYGKIEGPPIIDDRFTTSSGLKKALKKQVENSYEVSNSFNTVDLQYMGYSTHEINEGDHVWCVSRKLKKKLQLRIIEISETFDVEGKLLNAEYTVGNTAITKAYKAQQRSALYEFTASLKGNRKLPKSVLPGAVMFYTNLLNEAKSSFQYLPTGVIGVDENNPLMLIKIRHNGLGISEDGGKTYKTAITGAGIVADVINTGMLNTNNVKIQGTEGHFWIDGDMLKAVDYDNPKRFTEISPDNITTAGTLTVLRDDGGYPFIVAGKNKIGQRLFGASPTFSSPNVEINGQRFQTSSNQLTTVDAYYFDHFFDSLKAQVAIANYGDTPYTAKIALSGFGGWNKDFSETVTVNPGGSTYISVGGYIGIPDGKEKQFYIQMASLTENRSVSMSILIVRNYDG